MYFATHSILRALRRCAPLYIATLVILPYFTLINSVKTLTKPIKVKYGNITSVATYNGAHLRIDLPTCCAGLHIYLIMCLTFHTSLLR